LGGTAGGGSVASVVMFFTEDVFFLDVLDLSLPMVLWISAVVTKRIWQWSESKWTAGWELTSYIPLSLIFVGHCTGFIP
jgi:hypothetical protein